MHGKCCSTEQDKNEGVRAEGGGARAGTYCIVYLLKQWAVTAVNIL